MLLLDISFHLSLYFLPSSLDLMTLISTLPLSPLDIKHVLQTESQPSLCLHLLLLLTKLFWPYYQNTKHLFFRKITTKLCSLVLIDSHAVMISGLHWVFHTTCPEPVSLSVTPHPLPAFILLYKVLPWIYSFLHRRWPYLFCRSFQDQMGPSVLSVLSFSSRHWSVLAPLPASPPLLSMEIAYLLFSKYWFIFNWRIIALQCCVGFCHTSTWISLWLL